MNEQGDKNLSNQEIIHIFQEQIAVKDKEIDELNLIISSLTHQNEKLKNHNRELTSSLSKTKKVKNMEIQTLNKIIKNLKEQCEKYAKEQNQMSDSQSENQRQLEENQYFQYEYKHNDSARYLKRIKTQKEINFKRNSQEGGLRDIVHEMRLQIADMKHSHIKMHEENEKMHKLMKEHLSKRSTPYQGSLQSQKNQYNLTFQGFNMGQCFMGRKSRIQLNNETQKPWGKMHELNWNNKSAKQQYKPRQYKKKINTRPQSQAARGYEIQSWQGIQEKLNFIKQQNQELKRPVFG